MQNWDGKSPEKIKSACAKCKLNEPLVVSPLHMVVCLTIRHNYIPAPGNLRSSGEQSYRRPEGPANYFPLVHLVNMILHYLRDTRRRKSYPRNQSKVNRLPFYLEECTSAHAHTHARVQSHGAFCQTQIPSVRVFHLEKFVRVFVGPTMPLLRQINHWRCWAIDGRTHETKCHHCSAED